MTSHQILRNILPLYDSVAISKRERAFTGYAGTHNVEVTDTKSLADSLFLAKSSIIDLFSDLLQEERGFKYVLLAVITLMQLMQLIDLILKQFILDLNQ